MSMFEGLFVCIYARAHLCNLCGRGSVLLWWRCDTLCIPVLPVLWMTSHFPYWATWLLLQRRRCSAVNGLTFLLRGTGCILCYTTADAKTIEESIVLRVPGEICDAPLPCYFFHVGGVMF